MQRVNSSALGATLAALAALVLVGIPTVYDSVHHDVKRWRWPTTWMAAPLALAVLGLLMTALPFVHEMGPKHDERLRSILRSVLDSVRRGEPCDYSDGVATDWTHKRDFQTHFPEMVLHCFYRSNRGYRRPNWSFRPKGRAGMGWPDNAVNPC